MTVTIPNAYLSTPTVAKINGTLLDAATITESIEWMDTEALSLSYNCMSMDTAAEWPCPANLVAAPVQSAATTATTGGTLAAGTYRIRVTAISARGETGPSNEITRVTTGSTSTITINWADVANETGYRIYVSPVNGAAGTERYVTQTAAGATSYVWTGTPAADPTRTYPSTNTAIVSVTKTLFNSPTYQDGFRFQVYGGVGCESVGYDREEGMQNAVRVFQNKESVAVEKALMANRFIASAGNWPAPTDITPAAGAVKPAVGLALLEQHAGIGYAGAPTLHATRAIGALLFDTAQLEVRGSTIYSPQGSKVASGAGYGIANQSPAGVAAPAGESWMYATGEVSVARGALIQKWELNRDNNEVVALVERPYMVAVDCYAAAVRVKVE